MRKVTGDTKHNTNLKHVTYSSQIPTFFWVLANMICVLGLVLQATTIYTPNWRTSKPIVGETRYGLHFILFNNGGFVQTWQSKVESVKSKGYTAIQHNEMVGKGTYRSFQGSYCPAACRNAILVRMEGYERMMKMNNALSLALVVVCTLVALGVGWYILFDADITVSGGLWITAAIIGAGGTYGWSMYTHSLWRTICSQQQIPYPHISKNVMMSYAASGLFVGGCLLLVLTGFFFHWRHTRNIQRMLNAHLQNKQNNMDPFNDPMSFDMFKPSAPSAPGAQPPQQGLNPGQLFSGIGFNQGQQPGFQYPQGGTGTGPTMWNTNLQY